MTFPDQKIVEFIRKRYTPGTKVELVEMNDAYREMPAGLRGVVIFVDDAGTIHVNWENGSTLGVIYGEDKVRIIRGGIE